jgi:hypothetical protein
MGGGLNATPLGSMKIYISLLLFIIVFSSCSTKRFNKPDLVLNNIVEDINIGMNYEAVNKVLTEKYGLHLLHKTKYSELHINYSYSCDSVNKISYDNLRVFFVNNSLEILTIEFNRRTEEEIEKVYKHFANYLDKEMYRATNYFWLKHNDKIEWKQRWITLDKKSQKVSIDIIRPGFY